MLKYEYMHNLDNTIIGRRQANEVPSVFNQLAEYDDTVHVATSLTKSIQMSADKVPDSAITDETNKRLKISASYAVVSTEDVRKNINCRCSYRDLVKSLLLKTIYPLKACSQYFT